MGQIILRLLEQIPEYRTYVAEETGGTGVRLEGTAEATAKFDALGFGKYSKGINQSRIAHFEYGAKGEANQSILAQWTTDPETNATLKMSWTDEAEATFWAGLEADLSYGARLKYARELGAVQSVEREVAYDAAGSPEKLTFTVISQSRDETQAGVDIDPRGPIDWGAIAGQGVEYQIEHRYIMVGESLEQALVRAPGLARLEKVEQQLSGANPLQIGRAPAQQDLTALLGCDPSCMPDFTYEKWVKITTDFQPGLELGFTAVLELEIGGEFKVQWGKDVLLERGVVRGGAFYPLETYTLDAYVDAPERDLGWLIDQAVQAAFDWVKDFFNTVQQTVQDGAEWIVNAVATGVDGIVQGTLQLIGPPAPLAVGSTNVDAEPFTLTATGWVPVSAAGALAQAAALGIQATDPGFVVGGVFELQPYDQTLTAPATMVLTYTDAEAGTRDEAQFHLYRWQPADNAWRPQVAELDAAANQATASISTLGTYAIGHDVEPPVVLEVLPAAGVAQVTYQPEFRIALDDAGAGIDPTSIQLTVAGAPVTATYDPVLKLVSYAPSVAFSNGDYTLELTAVDTAGNALSFNSTFTIAVPAPTVSSVTPSPVYEGISNDITVIGSGFFPGALVSVGSHTPDEVVLLSGGSLAVTLPATVPAGIYPVTVTNPDGQTATLPDALSVVSLVPLNSVVIAGPTEDLAPAQFTFTATANPAGVALPVQYVWSIAGREPVTHTGGPTDSFTASWDAPGEYQVTVSATNPGGNTSATHIVTVLSVSPPVLTTSRSGVDLLLSWQHLGAGIDHYEAHGSGRPYFSPDGSSLLEVVYPTGSDPLEYPDTGRVGAGVDFFYAVAPVGANGWTYPASNRTGVFNFALVPGGQ